MRNIDHNTRVALQPLLQHTRMRDANPGDLVGYNERKDNSTIREETAEKKSEELNATKSGKSSLNKTQLVILEQLLDSTDQSEIRDGSNVGLKSIEKTLQEI